jgi:uncharacterized protein (TIGR01777 family)
LSKVAVTGATGVIGRAVVQALTARGDEVVALSRDAEKASSALGVPAVEWADPKGSAAPAAAFEDVSGVIHLLGEPVAQRWSDDAKREIRDSRVLGTRNLVEGMRSAGPRLSVLVAQSATGYYGPHGDEVVDESAEPGSDFLAGVVVDWEAEVSRAASELGLRAPRCRTGVVLSESGGALAQMLTPFKLGVGGPVAGGRQYLPWVHIDDVVGAMLFALDNEAVSGPINVTAPEPATNAGFSKALGRALHRPAFMPVPGFAVRLLYGQMAEIVTTGKRAIPRRLQELGYQFRQPELEPALRSVVGGQAPTTKP